MRITWTDHYFWTNSLHPFTYPSHKESTNNIESYTTQYDQSSSSKLLSGRNLKLSHLIVTTIMQNTKPKKVLLLLSTLWTMWKLCSTVVLWAQQVEERSCRTASSTHISSLSDPPASIALTQSTDRLLNTRCWSQARGNDTQVTLNWLKPFLISRTPPINHNHINIS